MRDTLDRPVWSRPLRECRNIERQKNVIRLIHKKITDIRNNYLHQVTTEIVKTKPSRIVMENLNVRGMMKNRHLSRAIAEQKFYEFKRQIRYKCERYGIAFVEVYICAECGLKIDRDLNAAINLANYKI